MQCYAGHIDHSARVMRVITWNRSFRGIPGDGKDENSEDYETHATVLDKLLAWEKKLYDEVKVHCISLFRLICLLPFILIHYSHSAFMNVVSINSLLSMIGRIYFEKFPAQECAAYYMLILIPCTLLVLLYVVSKESL